MMFAMVAAFAATMASTSARAGDPTDAGLIPHLDTRGQAAYRQFLSAAPHRAFAIAPGGGWGWSLDALTPQLALEQALASCQEYTRQTCVPYALDRRLVFDADAWPKLWRPYLDAEAADRVTVGIGRGQRFPDLRLEDPQGVPWRLAEQRGKVVVLHFWGTWCPTCVHEIPQFETLQAAFAERDDIIFVYSQARESAATARAWLAQHGFALGVHDSGAGSARDQQFQLGDGSSIPDREIAPLFPATYVLDRHGVVVFGLRGSARDWLEYEPFLRDLLEHQSR